MPRFTRENGKLGHYPERSLDSSARTVALMANDRLVSHSESRYYSDPSLANPANFRDNNGLSYSLWRP
jgi:hypothetical protein